MGIQYDTIFIYHFIIHIMGIQQTVIGFLTSVWGYTVSDEFRGSDDCPESERSLKEESKGT